MSKILKIAQSNYIVQVADGGKITLDTGIGTGQVFITGDLIVQGETTTINTTQMTVEDNIITLNKGETGVGVTEGFSGIEVDRGTVSDAQLIFSEEVTSYNPVVISATATSGVDHSITISPNTVGLAPNSRIRFYGTTTSTGITADQDYWIKDVLSNTKITISETNGGALFTGITTSGVISLSITVFEQPGTWVFRTADGVGGRISLGGITANPATDFIIDLKDSGNFVKIASASTYSDDLLGTNLLDTSKDNALVNRKFVTNYVTAFGGSAVVDKIFKGNPSNPLDPLTSLTEVLANTYSIDFLINDGTVPTIRAQINASGLQVDNINIFNRTIKSNVNYNLTLTTSSTADHVEVSRVLDLADQGSFEVPAVGKTKLFSKTGLYNSDPLSNYPGKTGIFFANAVNTDELISKNRAVLLSILL
jgi:hypothetical protein